MRIGVCGRLFGGIATSRRSTRGHRACRKQKGAENPRRDDNDWSRLCHDYPPVSGLERADPRRAHTDRQDVQKGRVRYRQIRFGPILCWKPEALPVDWNTLGSASGFFDLELL